MRLTLKTEEQHGHDGVVVRGEPVLHPAEAGLGGGAAKQVVDDRPGDNEAADDQRSDRVGGREPELGEPGAGRGREHQVLRIDAGRQNAEAGGLASMGCRCRR